MKHFKDGEKLFYPNRGLCVLEKIDTHPMSDGKPCYYVCLLKTKAHLVATENVQLRRPATRAEVPAALQTVAAAANGPFPPCSPEFYRGLEKTMREGTFRGVAEVYGAMRRIVSRRAPYKTENILYSKSKELLVEEIAYATGVDSDEAERMIQEARLNAGCQIA